MPNPVVMPTSSILKPRNLLLKALPVSELSGLRPHLESVYLSRGSIVFDAGEALTRVYFVETCVISLLAVVANRAAAGVAAVGREGAIEVATLLLGGKSALGRYQVLVPGAALAVQASRFQSALRESPKLEAACEASARALIIQVLQTVSCGKLHTAEQRCARWLLMCADQTENDTLELVQESLAEMLDVPGPTVTDIACRLQQAGLIRYRSGAFTVLDRPGLEAAACECYRIVRDRYQGLLARFLA